MTDPLDSAAPQSADTLASRHPMLVYTLLRLVLFAAPFLLLLAVGMDVVWALLIAAILSSFVSLFVLGRFRDQLSISLSERKERIRVRMAERETSEDAWDDEQRAKEQQRLTEGETDDGQADASDEASADDGK